MKIISGLTRFRKSSASRHNRAIVFALILTATLSFTGCGKPKPPSTQTTADQNTNQAAADQNTSQAAADHMPVSEQPSATTSAATPAATPVMASTQKTGEPDLADLNHSLLRWVVGNQRRPNNFEEFAATADTPIPSPPAGKKFIIAKNMHIQLVDR